MADISKIRPGDDLLIKARVLEVAAEWADVAQIKVSFGGNFDPWLVRATVDSAEHIPAPKSFKRGDWVRRVDSFKRNGIVLFLDGAGRSVVSWPGHQDPQREFPVDLELQPSPESAA